MTNGDVLRKELREISKFGDEALATLIVSMVKPEHTKMLFPCPKDKDCIFSSDCEKRIEFWMEQEDTE